MSALAPSRIKVYTKYAAKAMLAGNITNFISGKHFKFNFPFHVFI